MVSDSRVEVWWRTNRGQKHSSHSDSVLCWERGSCRSQTWRVDKIWFSSLFSGIQIWSCCLSVSRSAARLRPTLTERVRTERMMMSQSLIGWFLLLLLQTSLRVSHLLLLWTRDVFTLSDTVRHFIHLFISPSGIMKMFVIISYRNSRPTGLF